MTSTRSNDWRPSGIRFDWLPRAALGLIERASDPRGALCLYIGFVRAANRAGVDTFEASLSYVARLGFMSRREAWRQIPELERLGLVLVERRLIPGTKGHALNHYTVPKSPKEPCAQQTQGPCVQSAQPCGNNVDVVGTHLKNKKNSKNKKGSPSGSRVSSEAKPTRPKWSKPKADPVPIPAELAAVDGFAEAWDEWLAYRKRRGLTRDPATVRRQLARLAEKPTAAVGVIETSLTNGWQSLFPSTATHSPHKVNRAAHFKTQEIDPRSL